MLEYPHSLMAGSIQIQPAALKEDPAIYFFVFGPKRFQPYDTSYSIGDDDAENGNHLLAQCQSLYTQI
jgi:hypothetical protein